MSYEVVGKLIKKYDMESKTGTFHTRDFVIEIEGRYPEYPKFQLVQDRCSIIDAFQEGDIIQVSFDLRGREWQGKYFTNLNAWRIVPADGEPHKAPAPADVTDAAPASNWNAPATIDVGGQTLPVTVQANLNVPRLTGEDAAGDDDLPF